MAQPQDRTAAPKAGTLPAPAERSPAPSLRGRRALVVGGTGGLGLAAASALARRGASLVVHGGSSRPRLDAALAQLSPLAAAHGAAVEGFLQPVSRPADLVGRLPYLGNLDILVVAFGPFLRKSLAETTPDDWERLALLDLALPGALCSALLPEMAARGWGRILLFGGSRTDGIRAYSSNAAYAAAKTGLAVLAKSLAAEGAGRGVACVLTCPGLVDTEFLDEPGRAALRLRAPGGRLLSPAEVAEPAVALIAADPCAASGAVLSMDGGLSL